MPAAVASGAAGASQAAAWPCRPGCGACCIAPSISSPMPGAPRGKAAGVPCVHLGPQRECLIFDQPDRPRVCASLQPSRQMCGDSPAYALQGLMRLEQMTAPD